MEPDSARIAELRLTDFRSYSQLDAAFAPGLNVLYGANGAGKTNLLEAISFLSPGRGLRRAKIEEVTRRNRERVAPAWGVSATVEAGADTYRLSIGQNPTAPRRRLTRLDGDAATGTQLAELITIMWLTPAQDRLFVGPASDRRRFLDRFTLSHTPTHGQVTARYEQLRAERNKLLSENISDAAWYRALETELAELGAKIAGARVSTLALLREEIASRPDGAFPKAVVNLEGQAEESFLDGRSRDEVSTILRTELETRRGEERRAGRTLVGPHRADLRIIHAPKDMPAENCSTGEQKALLLGLVLAHARSHPVRVPILLLDEVAAHLDAIRREALAEELAALNGQAFLTGTDRSLFSAFEVKTKAGTQMMEVRDGDVVVN